MIKKNISTLIFSTLIFVLNLSAANSATIEWSWDYGTEEPELILLTSSSSFDINIKITNEADSDRAIYLAPYSIPDGYYYEGFYEFQSNVSEVVDTIIQPGETSYLNLGTWVPVGDGLAPYVNIQAQPKYLEVYFFDDNGSKLESGQESLNLLELKIWGAIDPALFDPYNPGQGIFIEAPGIQLPPLPLHDPGTLSTPIPNSMLLFEIGLLGFVWFARRRRPI